MKKIEHTWIACGDWQAAHKVAGLVWNRFEEFAYNCAGHPCVLVDTSDLNHVQFVMFRKVLQIYANIRSKTWKKLNGYAIVMHHA